MTMIFMLMLYMSMHVTIINKYLLIKINKEGHNMTTCQSKTAQTCTKEKSHIINFPLRIFFHLKIYPTCNNILHIIANIVYITHNYFIKTDMV